MTPHSFTYNKIDPVQELADMTKHFNSTMIGKNLTILTPEQKKLVYNMTKRLIIIYASDFSKKEHPFLLERIESLSNIYQDGYYYEQQIPQLKLERQRYILWMLKTSKNNR